MRIAEVLPSCYYFRYDALDHSSNCFIELLFVHDYTALSVKEDRLGLLYILRMPCQNTRTAFGSIYGGVPFHICGGFIRGRVGHIRGRVGQSCWCIQEHCAQEQHEVVAT